MFLGCETEDFFSHYKDLHTFEEDKEINSEIKEGMFISLFSTEASLLSLYLPSTPVNVHTVPLT